MIFSEKINQVTTQLVSQHKRHGTGREAHAWERLSNEQLPCDRPNGSHAARAYNHKFRIRHTKMQFKHELESDL
jgi:hypothetical protein